MLRALPHHDAAFGDQRRGGEAELVGAEQRADDDVATGFHLAVGLDRIRPRRRLSTSVCCVLASPSPGRAGADRAHGEGAAVVAGDDDVVGLGLGHAGRDRADAGLRDQLDADARLLVGVLQVVDQLRQSSIE